MILSSAQKFVRFTSWYASSHLHIVLLLSGASKAAPVFPHQLFYLIELDLRLIFHNAELTDSVIHMNLGIPHGNHRHPPHIIITTIRTVHNATMVCLDHTEIFICAASRYNVRLISCWKLHCHPQRDQCKVSCL